MRWRYTKDGEYPQKSTGDPNKYVHCFVEVTSCNYKTLWFDTERLCWEDESGDYFCGKDAINRWIPTSEIINESHEYTTIVDNKEAEDEKITYINCKIKIADYSEYVTKFSFSFGGEATLPCKLAHNTYALTGYMRDIVPVDLTVKNGSIIKVEPHKNIETT